MSGVEGRNIGNYDGYLWGTSEIKAGKTVGKKEGYNTLNEALDVAKAAAGAEVITEKTGKFYLNEVRGSHYTNEGKSEVSVRAYPSVNFSKFVAFTDDNNNVISQFNNTANLEKFGNIDQIKAKLAMMPPNTPPSQALKVAGTMLGVASPATYRTSEKIMEALKLMPKYLPEELRSKFQEMLTPKNLAILSATLAAYAASHAFGVGEAADAVLLGVGLAFLGNDAIKVGKDFYNFASVAANAKTPADLEKAAKHLADGLSTALIDGAMVAAGARATRGRTPAPIGEKPPTVRTRPTTQPRPVETTPPVRTQPKPVEAKPTEVKPTETKPVETPVPKPTLNTKIEIGKQEKHIPGKNNFEAGKSEITISVSELQSLVNKYAGKGTLKGKTPLGQPGSKEVVDFGKVIGYHVDPVTGVKTPTTKGTIHYSKNGVHVVPARE
ncbi:MAG: polymorphic toxin type 50 domain-containing protein [Candidatus Sericytochromatia bacterium]